MITIAKPRDWCMCDKQCIVRDMPDGSTMTYSLDEERSLFIWQEQGGSARMLFGMQRERGTWMRTVFAAQDVTANWHAWLTDGRIPELHVDTPEDFSYGDVWGTLQVKLRESGR